MRSFSCPHCGQLVFFENSACLRCDTKLGFDPATREIVRATTRCANAGVAGCNWLDPDGALCASCRLTRTRPSDADAEGLAELKDAEAAKRRLLFELAELGIGWDGLAFDFLSSREGPVTTGHADGLITLDLAEVDDVHRERMRTEMDEPYRTVLGHLRHETGHFEFERLVPEGPAREQARALFGDERADYQAALDAHYAQGPPPDWAQRHVSAYATMHPAEDWAETFAHYLHIVDSVQTAFDHGLAARDERILAAGARSLPELDDPGFAELLGAWLPLVYALNAMQRSMGRPDLYPFVLTPPVVEKLAFVHGRVVA